LLTFFGEAKKVSAPPGAHPGSPTQRTAGVRKTQAHQTPVIAITEDEKSRQYSLRLSDLTA
jgi:hypothetical protein